MFFIKPEARERQKEILKLVESGGLSIVEMYDVIVTSTLIDELYGHVPSQFFLLLKHQLCDKVCLFGRVEGERAVERMVEIVGEKSYATECRPGTIRFVFGDRRPGWGHFNAIHRPKTAGEVTSHLELFAKHALKCRMR